MDYSVARPNKILRKSKIVLRIRGPGFTHRHSIVIAYTLRAI